MGKVFDEIDDKLAGWIARQHMFFVGTAPAGAEGSINVSPKGMGGTFAVLGPRRVGYLDYTGSGTETIAHLRENGRIVVMFCAFDGPPKIVRLHGTGRVVLATDPEFAELRPAFSKGREVGQRSIIVADLTRISDSCGYSVPLMDYRDDRDILDKVQVHNGEDYYPKYGRDHNAASIDGIPGVPTELSTRG
ncbi:MAG: pyridoxamine 5'-phosphate oxidase family protein [Nakamurella sp.]